MARVLLVGKGPPERGGIPAFLLSLLDGPIAAEHTLTLLNLTRTDATPQGGRVTGSNISRTLADVAAVWRQAPQHDLVHLHSALAPGATLLRAGALALAARLRGAGVIVHAHGGLLERWMTSRLRRRLVWLALLPAHLVIAVSAGGLGVLERTVPARRRALLGNGVDVERFHPGPGAHEPPRLLYVGILTPRKGVVDLLQASAALHADGVPHELWLAGGMPDEGPEAERAVRDADDGAARFLGSRSHEEMPALYREVDVFCLPSWWEASPLSVLEAMASGLPVVATAVGDIPATVEDGCGTVVAPHDVEALTAALRALLTDPDRRHRQGRRARELAESRHAVAATQAGLSAHYARVAGRKP